MGFMEDLNVLKRDLNKVTKGNGTKVLIQIFFTYFLFCKAMARDWVLASMFAYYTIILGQDTAIMDTLYTAARSPFGIKTLWGSLSDALPFAGYHKRWYIMWGASVSIAALIGLIILGSQWEGRGITAPLPTVQFMTGLVFLFEYGGATVDSLTQARYTELMKAMGTPTIVSFVWLLINACSLLSAFGNLLLREGWYLILLWLALPASLPMLMPAALNYLQEEPAASFCTPDFAKITKYGGIFAMSMVLAFGALGGTALLVFFVAAPLRAVYFIVLSTIFVIMAYMYLPRRIASPAFYMFLCSSLRLFFSGSLQGFYTLPNTQQGLDNCAAQPFNSLESCNTLLPGQPEDGLTLALANYTCIPDGPGFSLAYYQFVGGFIGAFAASVAVVIFEKVIVHWNVRAAFWVTTIFQMCSALLEITLLERYNFRLFGQDPADEGARWVDQLFFLLGTQALDKIIEMLDFMPCNVLIGKLCPANMEATIFAVLAGSQNFGTNIAFVFGAIVVTEFGVTFSTAIPERYVVEDEQEMEAVSRQLNQMVWCENPSDFAFNPFGWTGLTIARALGGIVLPAITIPLTFVLLPNIGLSDDFLEEDNEGQELAEAGAAPEGSMAQPAPSLGSIPRGMSGISATSFVSAASMTRGPMGRGQYL